MTEDERFIKEQNELRERFYYGNFGNKLMQFYLEMIYPNYQPKEPEHLFDFLTING